MIKKLKVLASAAMIGVALVSGGVGAQGTPQTIELVKVDVQKLAAGYRSSKVVGSSVVNDANETIGKIDDLLVSSDGKQPYAVLSIGGFLGVGTCRPSRDAEVRRQKGDIARRHQGGAQNAARVQIRYGVIPTGVAEVVIRPADGCRTE
jgi:hypothetical protein